MIEEKELRLDEDIKLFADKLKICFSKEEIEEIAKETGFVKRKGKIKASEFVCLCCFMDVEVANNTLVSLCTKLSAKMAQYQQTCHEVQSNFNKLDKINVIYFS